MAEGPSPRQPASFSLWARILEPEAEEGAGRQEGVAWEGLLAAFHGSSLPWVVQDLICGQRPSSCSSCRLGGLGEKGTCCQKEEGPPV